MPEMRLINTLTMCARVVFHRTEVGLFGAIVLLPALLTAQDGSTPQTSPGARSSESASVLRAGNATGAIDVDGLMEEPIWATADSIDDFRQREPNQGAPATERAVVKVAHDAEALYV